jgi:pimeloyl-ACP methyl ester carboxylesterase
LTILEANDPATRARLVAKSDTALAIELVARLKEFNPIDNLAGLAANKVPMFAVHGDSDVVVPYDLNTQLLKERYEAAGGSFSVKIVPGEGHKVGPSFFECRELVEFVLALP